MALREEHAICTRRVYLVYISKLAMLWLPVLNENHTHTRTHTVSWLGCAARLARRAHVRSRSAHEVSKPNVRVPDLRVIVKSGGARARSAHLVRIIQRVRCVRACVRQKLIV